VAKKGHSEGQILRALRQADGGTRAADIYREHGISEATYYIWKTRCSVQGLSELREPRQLRGADGVCAQHAAGVGVGD
jgi:putative transposase